MGLPVCEWCRRGEFMFQPFLRFCPENYKKYPERVTTYSFQPFLGFCPVDVKCHLGQPGGLSTLLEILPLASRALRRF
jgi:hypothetical protein